MQTVDSHIATICIVGAGPAGTYAAIKLAQKGIPSLLIDKAIFPRDKVCGEALTSGVLRCIQKLDASILSDNAFIEAKRIVNGVKLYAPNGKSFYLPFYSHANIAMNLASSIGIRRIDLDNILLEYAKKQPLITIKEGVGIDSVERKNGGLLLFNKEKELQIETQMLIVANGYASKLAKQLAEWDWNAETDACGITAFYRNVAEISDSDHAECLVLEELKSGGMYIMPVGNGIVNVNIAVRNDIVKKYKLNLREIMQNALTSHPALKERFQHAELIRKPMGSGFHLGIKKRPVSGDNFVLVGDAGAFNDALTANGIAHAMISADFAVAEILSCYEKGNFSAQNLKNYDKTVYKSFYTKRLLGYLSFPLLLRTRLLFFLINTYFDMNLSPEVLGMVMYEKYPWRLLFYPTFYLTILKSLIRR